MTTKNLIDDCIFKFQSKAHTYRITIRELLDRIYFDPKISDKVSSLITYSFPCLVDTTITKIRARIRYILKIDDELDDLPF